MCESYSKKRAVEGTDKEKICGMVKSRESKSLFFREGSPLFLQDLNKRLPWITEGETFFPVYVVRMELNLYSLPWWCVPYVLMFWSGYWCHETGCGDPSLCCAQTRLTSIWYSLMCRWCSLNLVSINTWITPKWASHVTFYSLEVKVTNTNEVAESSANMP
jgi:hypothetical protein